MLRIHRIQFKREAGIPARRGFAVSERFTADKGRLFLVVRVSQETVGRCHGIACRRLAGGQDIRLSTAKRPCERPCAASYSRPLCRPSLSIGALLRPGPSRLSSRTRNDRFRQPAGHIWATHAKNPPISSFIYSTTMVLSRLARKWRA